jgi:NitT/TauT family transport system substrate-binding protein
MRCTAGLLLACLAVLPAAAAETIKVGNDAPASTSYCTLDYGIAHDIFKNAGLTIESSNWSGATKGQPAIIGGTIDILLGAGSEMAFIAKGAPERAVAVATGAPANVAVAARADGPVHTLDDLKGRRIGVTTSGGLTDWLAHQVIRQQGFAPDQITVIAAGTTPTEAAMLATGEVDAAIMDSMAAHTLESKGAARIVRMFGTYVPDFAASIIYASNDLMQHRPDTLRAFLAAYFTAQRALLNDKPAFIACAAQKAGAPPDIAAKVFDEIAAAYSRDGRFSDAAMNVLAQSFVDTGVLPAKPDMHTLYTDAFLPPG